MGFGAEPRLQRSRPSGGVASSVTCRLHALSLRPARRTPRQKTPSDLFQRQGRVRLRRRFLLGESRRARARLAVAEWGTRGPRGAVAWGSGRRPVCRGRARLAVLLRRSHAACLLPPRALPDGRLVRKPPRTFFSDRDASAFGVACSSVSPGAHLRASRSRGGALGVPAERSRGVRGRAPSAEVAPVWRCCFVGHMPPACSLLAPCQTDASSENPLGPFSATGKRPPSASLPPR